jgi:O-methyltransferase/methyltransferase family protein
MSKAPKVAAAAPEAPAPQDVIVRMANGYVLSQAVYTAARFDIAGRLANGPRTAADLAKDCAVLPDRLERLLRMLAGEGVFRRTDDGRYENTELSSVLRDGVERNVRHVTLMLGEEQYLAWSRFHECLAKPTTAFERFFGEPIFTWYARHESEARTFNRAMQDISALQIPALVEAYPTSEFRRIVDVGGGHGDLLAGLLAGAPEARGVVYDLEQGLAAARAAGRDRDPRIELVAGDFFKSAPAGGDLYVLKSVLHDWDDDRCATILSHIRKAMAPGGRVLVAEHLVGPHNAPDFAKWMDLHMMAMPGGRERTPDEFAAIFERAGLRLARTIRTRCPIWLIEARAG